MSTQAAEKALASGAFHAQSWMLASIGGVRTCLDWRGQDVLNRHYRLKQELCSARVQYFLLDLEKIRSRQRVLIAQEGVCRHHG